MATSSFLFVQSFSRNYAYLSLVLISSAYFYTLHRPYHTLVRRPLNEIRIIHIRNYMRAEDRIQAFVALGEKMATLSDDEKHLWAIQARANNNWFTPENIEAALQGISIYLQEDKLRKWMSAYTFPTIQKRVGVVMAGNIPAAGFHDFMCVLLSGHVLYAKLSSQDNVLLQRIARILIDKEPEFASRIHFVDRLNGAEIMIATGSDNSARYFKYYFGKIPHIIRQNRTSCAVLSGKEDTQDYELLGKDIFLYFGLGCRNVSKLYVPVQYDFNQFFEGIELYKTVLNHHKYINNYDYNKSIYLVNQVPHQDNGFLLLTQSTSLVSPVSVVYFEEYSSQEELLSKIQENRNKIQCIISRDSWLPESIPFGQAQSPQIWDYADGVDTMQFLTSLS